VIRRRISSKGEDTASDMEGSGPWGIAEREEA
jgi:hypothetical protein